MKKTMITAVLTLTLGAAGSLASFAAWADGSPVGLWKIIDESGKSKALIRIVEVDGELKGKIENLLRDPDQDQNPKCVKCEGPLKDEPMIGMTILYGLKKDGNEYVDGKIVDPSSGKVYSSKLSVSDDGKKLNVRGFVGISLLGRTQTWLRQE